MKKKRADQIRGKEWLVNEFGDMMDEDMRTMFKRDKFGLRDIINIAKMFKRERDRRITHESIVLA